MSVSKIFENDVVQQVNLFSLIRLAWAEKWLIISFGFIAAICTLIYVFSVPEWYESEILLAPVDNQPIPQLAGDLGSLASLAGLEVGDSTAIEAKAVLTSRDLTRQFIEDNNLLTLFFADEWDSENGEWKSLAPDDRPDIRDGIEYFDENIRKIREESGSGLITLSIEWMDPVLASNWANELVTRVNDAMRRRALEEAEAKVAYLSTELTKSNQITIQQSVSRVLERELQKLVLAKGNKEFAFRVLDSAQVPKYHSRPQRALIIATAVLFALIVAFLIAYLRNLYSQTSKAAATEDFERT